MAERIEQEAAAAEDMWEQLLFLGCRAFVLAAVEERNRRIMLIDGPAFLGWDAWREMDRSHSMRLLRDQLDLMQQQQGCLPHIPLDPLTHFISGGLNELALRIADQPNELDESLSVVRSLLDGWARMPN